MSFEIKYHRYPVLERLDFDTSDDIPLANRVKVESFTVAIWNPSAYRPFPTTEEVMDAVHKMKREFEGPYRILGLPKAGDFIFGVEIA